ncbi:MAG: hypothetical protein FJ221_01910 [Lentisphaerae bacterium]|nr:hypothetical protein [Lentisphaerota bacterium]
MTRHWLGILMAVAAAAAADAQDKVAVRPGMIASREIPYPTRFESQPVGIGGGVRPPIPSAFKTRQLGAAVSAANIGVQKVVVSRNGPRLLYTAQFADGTKAEFVDGCDTVVNGRRYRGMGLRGGAYVVKDMDSNEYLRFTLSAGR